MNKLFKIEIYFIIVAITLFISYLIFKNYFWDFFLVPIGNSFNDFTDLKCVQSWSRLYENFFDNNVVYNDLSGCALNYPKVWIPISKFLLKNNYTYYYLLITFIIYNYIFYYFIKKYKSYFFIYFYLSGVSLLLLERGNVEIIIFCLLFFSLVQKSILKLIFLYISIILKVFPIFSIISLFLSRNITYLILTVIFLILYFFNSFDQFKFIFENTPNSGDMSYGTKAITSNVYKHFNLYLNNYYLSILLIICSIISYQFFFKKKFEKIKYSNEEMFLCGSAIYVVTFLLGSNHDYRLIFLIFTVPLIINLNLNFYKNILIILILFSAELHRLIYFFGFFGGVLNTFSKILLCYFLTQFLIDIILKNFYKLYSTKKL